MHIHCKNIVPFPLAERFVSRSELWGKGLSFSKGEKILINAASGNGKTTLVNIILGIRKDYRGALLLDGKDVREIKPPELSNIRQKRLGIVPQSLELFGHLTALENITIKNRITKFYSQKQVIALMEQLGIGEQQNSLSARMSYGQNQRLAIIRALCQPFDFLLLDEPFSHLDGKNIEVAWQMIKQHADSQGAGIIITSLGNGIADGLTHVINL